MEEIEVDALADLRASCAPQVLDVREDWEVAICSLPDSCHIPLGQLMSRVSELDRSRPLVVVCHHGVRSRAAQGWLLSQGFGRVVNLAGGIDAYARQVDPAMATY